MANPEQLLRQGVVVWNKWRRENEEIRSDFVGAFLFEADLKRANLSKANLFGADLSKADLTRANLTRADLTFAQLGDANLSYANLCGADLTQANLTRANLTRADLRGADLTMAHLSEANLTRADLSEANLSGANLSGANLTQANLSGANLNRAELSGADLTKAVLSRSVLTATELSQAKGLESVIHHGPSSIGIDTFFRSKGKIPDDFLRGAGVPDTFIQYAASLVGVPFDFYSCVISYSTDEEEFATRLHNDFQAKGIRCWKWDHDPLSTPRDPDRKPGPIESTKKSWCSSRVSRLSRVLLSIGKLRVLCFKKTGARSASSPETQVWTLMSFSPSASTILFQRLGT